MSTPVTHVTSVKSPDTTLVTAGVVTVTGVPDEKAIADRKSQAGAASNRIVYTQPLGSGSDVYANVNIAVGDIVFAARNTSVSGQLAGGSLVRYAPKLLSSFNGMNTGLSVASLGLSDAQRKALDDLNREKLFNQLYPVGVSLEYYTFAEPTQNKAGLAPAVRVSGSILNTGLDAIRAGQLISVRPPPVDAALREDYLAKRRQHRPEVNGLPRDKLVLVTEPFNPQNAAWSVFRAGLAAARDSKEANASRFLLGSIFTDAIPPNLIDDIIGGAPTAERSKDYAKVQQIVQFSARLFSEASAHVIGRADTDGLPCRKFQATLFF